MAIPRRGVNNIRTLAGRVDQLGVPYRCYMQVTCLEMEKERRGAERRSAMERVSAIDRRLAVIAREKEAALMRIVKGPSPAKPVGRRQRVAGKPPAPMPSTSGFKIRY